jgi:tetratricopeptide (TPR) repeat protein
MMREEMHLDDAAAKVALLTEIATLQAGPLHDSSSAVATLERARGLAPTSTPILLALSDAYVAAGRGDDAIPVIEALIVAETDGGKKRSKTAAVYHQRLAKAYLARGDRDKALANLEGAYKIDMANTEVLISLGKLHYEHGDLDQAVKLFRALLLQKFDASAGASKADIYCYVGEISLKQGDARKAKGMFQRGLDEDKSHEGCKVGLAQC